jgi:ribosomal-protein-alanine N-acetyltransferase
VSFEFPPRKPAFSPLDPASRCWVAEVDGRVVGMIVAWLFVDEAHIATLATHPDFRRQGIAQELLTYTLRYTSDEGAVSSFLEVRESNIAAQAMYRKFGYENTGRRKRYYKDNDEDAILMTLMKINVEELAGE